MTISKEQYINLCSRLGLTSDELTKSAAKAIIKRANAELFRIQLFGADKVTVQYGRVELEKPSGIVEVELTLTVDNPETGYFSGPMFLASISVNRRGVCR